MTLYYHFVYTNIVVVFLPPAEGLRCFLGGLAAVAGLGLGREFGRAAGMGWSIIDIVLFIIEIHTHSNREHCWAKAKVTANFKRMHRWLIYVHTMT